MMSLCIWDRCMSHVIMACNCPIKHSLCVVICQVTGNHQAFGFVEFRSEEDCEYAIKVSVAIVRPED